VIKNRQKELERIVLVKKAEVERGYPSKSKLSKETNTVATKEKTSCKL